MLEAIRERMPISECSGRAGAQLKAIAAQHSWAETWDRSASIS
jgi:hypothetical protein